MTNTRQDITIDWQYLFSPGSIAVIGASNTKGSWGYSITQGLLSVPGRRVYPVNTKATEVLGVRAYPSVLDIPDFVDFAVIVVSAPLVPGVLRECASKKIKMSLIISAGFAEIGEEGRKLEADLTEIASQGALHFVGPNSMGHACTKTRISTFGQVENAPPGPVSLLSQSGSMTMTIVRMAMESGITFSKFISTGNETDLIMEDYLEYLAKDDDTKIITAYIEGLRDGRRFYRLAKEITGKKPIVVLKAGCTQESAKAVLSHTAALAGSDPVYTAAFSQSGVIRVDDDEELCDVVFALLNCPLPIGNRIGILSIGGGPGALAVEACEKEGLVISTLTPATLAKLDACLPPRWSHRNPVDMAGPAASEFHVVAPCIQALVEDENIDAVFVQAPIISSSDILARRLGLNSDGLKAYREKEKENLQAISKKVEETGKLVILSWMGRTLKADPEVSSILHGLKILTYSNARRAAKVMRYLTAYKRYLDRTAGKSWALSG